MCTHTHTFRLSVSRSGQVVYNHEPSPSWDINHYLQSMQQQEGLTPRDIYWRLWGVINILQCSNCHTVFQCCELPSCAYHPQSVVITTAPGGESLARPLYMCCKRPVNGFSTISRSQVCVHVAFLQVCITVCTAMHL